MRFIDLQIMTISRQRKILQRIAEVEEEISALKKTRREILESGYQSAGISTAGGSKSYSRLSPEKITAAIMDLQKELTGLRKLLGGGSALTPTSVITVYS